MKYYIFKNSQQEKQLENLLSNQKTLKETDTFKEIIISLVKDIRKNLMGFEKKIYLLPLFYSANQIIYAFHKYEEAKSSELFEVKENGEIGEINLEAEDTEEAMLLVFFVNAQALMDILSKYTNIKIDNQLKKDIKAMRNFLTHYYNKNIETDEYFVNVFKERGLYEHSVLNVRETDSGSLTFQIHFSLILFYYSIQNIFKTLHKDYVKSLK